MAKASQLKDSPVHHTIIFGAPKTGKTASVVRLAEHYNILYLGLEGGHTVFFNPELKISKGALDHVEIVAMPDRSTYPIAAETITKFIALKPISICDAHGKVSCPLCKASGSFVNVCFKPEDKKDDSWILIDNSWIIVIDSLTQLVSSIEAQLVKASGKPAEDCKFTFDDWRKEGVMLHNVLSAIQTSTFNWIVISHEIGVERPDGTEKISPAAGTKNNSRNAARYFDHSVYASTANRKHTLISNTTTRTNLVVGSRTGAITENFDDNPLGQIYKEYRNYKEVK